MRKITFRKLRAAGLEPGWNYVRLLPQDDAGIALPVKPPEHGGQPTNESERFFVIAPSEDDDDLDQLAPADKAELSAGLTQALRAFQFKTLGEERDWRAIQCRRIEWNSQRTDARSGERGAGLCLKDRLEQLSNDDTKLAGWCLLMNAASIKILSYS